MNPQLLIGIVALFVAYKTLQSSRPATALVGPQPIKQAQQPQSQGKGGGGGGISGGGSSGGSPSQGGNFFGQPIAPLRTPTSIDWFGKGDDVPVPDPSDVAAQENGGDVTADPALAGLFNDTFAVMPTLGGDATQQLADASGTDLSYDPGSVDDGSWGDSASDYTF